MLAALLNLGFAGGGVYVPPVTPPVTETPTGGIWARYRDEQEVRRRRIAMGIIPDDEPAREAIIEAASKPTATIARRQLRQIAETETRLAELDRLLSAVLEAQKLEDERAYQAMLAELQAVQAMKAQFTHNQNAMAVIVMLGLL